MTIISMKMLDFERRGDRKFVNFGSETDRSTKVVAKGLREPFWTEHGAIPARACGGQGPWKRGRGDGKNSYLMDVFEEFEYYLRSRTLNHSAAGLVG